MTLPQDYTVKEVASALGMSPRWVYAQIAAGTPHQRYGNRVKFTSEQVEDLRSRFAAVPTPVVRRRKAS